MENRRLNEALRSLQTADAKYRAMLTRSPVPFWIAQDEVIVFCNPAVLRMLAAETEDQVLGHSIYDFIHRDLHDFVRERVRTAMESNEAPAPADEILVRLDGVTIER